MVGFESCTFQAASRDVNQYAMELPKPSKIIFGFELCAFQAANTDEMLTILLWSFPKLQKKICNCCLFAATDVLKLE
jgi:hypothetical protein